MQAWRRLLGRCSQHAAVPSCHPFFLPLQLILDCFPEQQQALLARLEAHPPQQFAFLRSLVTAQQAQTQGPAGGSQAASPAGGAGGRPLHASSRSPALAPLLADMGVASLYLQLLCRFEPRSGALQQQEGANVHAAAGLVLHAKQQQQPCPACPAKGLIARASPPCPLPARCPVCFCSAALPAGPRRVQRGRLPAPLLGPRHPGGERGWVVANMHLLQPSVGLQASTLHKGLKPSPLGILVPSPAPRTAPPSCSSAVATCRAR